MKISSKINNETPQQIPAPRTVLSVQMSEIEQTIERINDRVRVFNPASFVLEDYGDGELEIASLEVTEKGCGVGSQIMNIICEHCDEKGLNLMVIPGGEGRKLRRLIRFYGKFGFDFDPASGIMRREPSGD